MRNVYIVNSGKFNFDYNWEVRANHKMVDIAPVKGGVMFGDRTVCSLSFCPPRQTALRDCELLLKVMYMICTN